MVPPRVRRRRRAACRSPSTVKRRIEWRKTGSIRWRSGRAGGRPRSVADANDSRPCLGVSEGPWTKRRLGLLPALLQHQRVERRAPAVSRCRASRSGPAPAAHRRRQTANECCRFYATQSCASQVDHTTDAAGSQHTEQPGVDQEGAALETRPVRLLIIQRMSAIRPPRAASARGRGRPGRRRTASAGRRPRCGAACRG